MPKYRVFLARTVHLFASLEIEANDRDQALEKVQNAIDRGTFGTVVVTVQDGHPTEWNSEEEPIEITGIEEEQT
jgi:hypothetical protein